MFSLETEYSSEKIKNSIVENIPYPHFIVDNIFSDGLYKKIIENRIPTDCLQTLKELNRVGSGYSDSRKVLNLDKKITILSEKQRLFWEPFTEWLMGDFRQIINNKFNISFENHLDILYTRDFKNYSLGPHTDSVKKVATFLFYIPKDNFNSSLGTSLYTPKKHDLTCEGNKHHKNYDFDIFKTVNYLPNRLFGFIKTDNSFHGVEQIVEDIERDIIIYDIQR